MKEGRHTWIACPPSDSETLENPLKGGYFTDDSTEAGAPAS